MSTTDAEMALAGAGAVKLKSGLVIEPTDIVGISADGIFEGYDAVYEWSSDDTRPPRFTPEQRRELADVVIARWNKWAETGKA